MYLPESFFEVPLLTAHLLIALTGVGKRGDLQKGSFRRSAFPTLSGRASLISRRSGVHRPNHPHLWATYTTVFSPPTSRADVVQCGSGRVLVHETACGVRLLIRTVSDGAEFCVVHSSGSCSSFGSWIRGSDRCCSISVTKCPSLLSLSK